MSDVVSFAEIDGQHVELLPTRTLLQSGGLLGGLLGLDNAGNPANGVVPATGTDNPGADDEPVLVG